MNSFFDWPANNPAAFATLTSAGVAASMAFLVAILTQFVTSKREQTKLLLGKLEELYLLINKSLEDNVTRFEAIDKYFHGNPSERKELEKIDDLYGLNHNKKIILIIRLYFPELSFIHQQLFHAQRDLNNLYYMLFANQQVVFENFIPSSGILAHFLQLMESEVISNRKKLTRDYWIFLRYKRTSAKDLEYRHNPPQVPVSNRHEQE